MTLSNAERSTAYVLDIVIEEPAWREAVATLEAQLHEVAAAVARFEPDLTGEVALRLDNDASVAQLNARFREKDRATNVLSFPGDRAQGWLGDIAMAYGVCAREADAEGVSLADHAKHLFVHGLLHLIGYQHEDDQSAGVMERRETEILASLGVSDPYGEKD